MVSIKNNSGKHLYSIDWTKGIIDISKEGVQYFIDNPQQLSTDQPKGVKFENEAQKMYDYLKYKK
jgi:hypothetical protein